MRWWHSVRMRMRSTARRSPSDRDLHDELEAFIADRAEHYVRTGLSAEAARRAAQLEIGGIERVKEDTRDVHAGRLLRAIAGDVRQGLQAQWRRPGQAAVLVAILALGVGANGAVFSIVRAVLLEPLPYRSPDRVAVVWTTPLHPPATTHDLLEPAMPRAVTSSDESMAVHDQAGDVLGATATYLSGQTNLGATFDVPLTGSVERVQGALATPNFFELLGVTAARGRVFTSADPDTAGPVLVLSDALWHRAFGGDPAVVGRQVTWLSGRPRHPEVFTIIGVLPPAFRFTYPRETDAWAIYPWSRIRAEAGAAGYATIARLADGVTYGAAEVRLGAIPTDTVTRKRPPEFRTRFALQPIGEWAVGQARPPLFLLSAVAVLLLLTACATVASALFVRTTVRRRELALRAALGAERGRLVWQLFAEGAALSLAGAAVGTGIAMGLTPVLRALLPPTLPRADELGVDWWMLAFFSATATVVALLAATAPAWRGSRMDIVGALKRASSTASADRATARWRQVLVGAQAAMATTLLLASVLLLVSYWRLSHVPLGFDGERVLTVEMRLLDAKYWPSAPPKGKATPPLLIAFQDQLAAGVRALPGVLEAGLTSAVPFRGVDFGSMRSEKGSTRAVYGHDRSVDPGYFSTLGIAAVKGRVFTDGDTATSPPVIVVSASYAREMFGETDPIGRVIGGTVDRAVVGVVPDMRYEAFDKDPAPAIYVPRTQSPSEIICVVARLSPQAGELGPAIAQLVKSLDPEIPVMNLSTIDHIVDSSVSDRRFYTTATTALAVLALVLTLAGLVTVISRVVVERRRELAIRAALGAPAGRLLGLVAGEGMLPALAGAAVGLVAMWALAGLLDAFLFRVGPRTPWAYAAVGTGVAAGALLAVMVPAYRALRLPPSAALRSD